MTTINLKPATVLTYLGVDNKFNGCREIQSIFCREDTPSRFAVEARIPAISTHFTPYTIRVIVEKDGSAIHSTSCNCPVGYKCKHINKVLHRIVDSPKNPLLERPSLKRKAETNAIVYIAFACKYYEYVGGPDDGRDRFFIDENEGYEILGMFFSKRAANRCAKERAYADEDESEEDDEDEDDDSVDASLFNFTSHDESDESYKYYDDGDFTFDKVWVERRTIEDASPDFRI